MTDKKNQKDLPPKSDDKPGKGITPRPKFNVYWIYGIIGLAIIGTYFLNLGSGVEEITRQRFEKEMLLSYDVQKIIIVNKERVEVYIKPDKLSSGKYKDQEGKGFSPMPKSGPQFYFTIGSVEVFEQQLQVAQQNFPEEEQIPVTYETKRNIFGEMFGWLLPILLLVAVWLFIFRRMSAGSGGGGAGNIFNVGKSKARIFDKDSHVKIDFKDVAGLEEAKVEIKEIVDFLKNPSKYTELGGKIPKGALLVGPPGTGKTLLAKAVAGEANVPFFSISGSDFVEMFVGVGASRVRDLFKQAKEKAPCIVFIDEIDAVGRARGKNPNFGANDERENTLNQLLTEMDGFDTNTGVIILAATNRADVLDMALLRAGRFDRQIHVELPDLKERNEIFQVHLRPLKLQKNLNVEFLSRQTPGFSGADIANVCNEAALIAARGNKKSVGRQDFLDAVDRIIGGLEKKNKIITLEEKRTIAYHEAGHATVSWLLEHANPLVKVTIIPRGKALGAAWYLPEERHITTTEQLLDELCAALGGRASEELNFNKISTGALNDLERVTKQAYAMVSYFGMSDKIGNLSFYDSTGQSEFVFNKPYSEKTAEVIDEEVNRIIEEQYERAKKTLRENMDGLIKLATHLLEKEVIFSEDVEKIFGPRKNHRTDLDGKPRSKRKSSTPREKASEAEPKLTKKEKEEETPRSKTA
ncbi:MAG: ATP-dependent zinc metalloprotease FtsH [Bacteroidales bacterium]|nr:ATP-dependent zinc metalloprotease FtsH [Bacteroidales bacterium]